MKPLLDSPAFDVAIFALLVSLPWELSQMWLDANSARMSYLQGRRH